MVNALVAIGVALAGAAGAVLRFVLDAWVRRRLPGFPWGTLLINLSGSFLLGGLTSVAASAAPAPWATVLGVGLLGGYTTFSTASQESLTLLRNHRWAAGLSYAVGSLTLAVGAAASGWTLGLSLAA